MPDRLLSLVIIAGCWIPPAAAGWAAARRAEGSGVHGRSPRPYRSLATFVAAWSAIWFLVNLYAMPPYLPGTTKDPLYRPPQAIAWLAVVSTLVVLPCGALAGALAYRAQERSRSRARG
jgi:hypothetical protein